MPPDHSRRRRPKRRGGIRLFARRRGYVLVKFALMLVPLLGMVGLVIDAGFLMAQHRQVQNAADAAALAVAMDKLMGESDADASSTATTYVRQFNGLPAAEDPVVNIPPAQGAYAGSSDYVEVVVTLPVKTFLIHLLPGVSPEHIVSARAVASYSRRPTNAGVIALDPNEVPGMLISGNGDVTINGTVIVNSEGGGFDEEGDPIPEPHLGGTAFDFAGNGVLRTDKMRIVGGVQLDDLGQIRPIDPLGRNPLNAHSTPGADPLAFLPVPSRLTDPVNVSPDEYFDVDVTGEEPVTLFPGVYHKGIKISGDVDVTFEPGIYVLLGDNGLNISGNGTATGYGVMFYNTGDDFDVQSGYPDTIDGPAYDGPNNPTGSNFGQINLSGNGSWNFTPLNNPNSPFHGMLFYQRRVNTKKVNISGNADFSGSAGMVYARWTEVYVSGNGDIGLSFVAGRFHVSGNGEIGIGPFGEENVPLVRQVYLVE